MNNTWYVGERISTYCIYCSERLQTFITNPNGNHSRSMHIKCVKEMRDMINKIFFNRSMKMKVEYVDDIKCAKCPNCKNYTIDQIDSESEHCLDCGWLDEIGHRCDKDGNIIHEDIQCTCEQCESD